MLRFGIEKFGSILISQTVSRFLNTGHLHPRVKQGMLEQMDAFSHTCFIVLGYTSDVDLCEGLNVLAPGDFPKKKAPLLPPTVAEVKGLAHWSRLNCPKRVIQASQIPTHVENCRMCRDKRLILLSCSLYNNFVWILVPLTVPDVQLAQA